MDILKQALLTVLMCGVVSLQPAYAQLPQVENQERREHSFHKIFDQLKLSEEQKKLLEVNKEKQREQMMASLPRMKAQKEALHQELMKPRLDMNKINTIQKQLKKNMVQMADNRLNSILEVRKILTPEQFSQFLNLMKERRKNKGLNKDESM